MRARFRQPRRLEAVRALQALHLGPQPARRLLAVGRAPLRRRRARALVGQRALLLAHRLRCGRRLSLRLAQRGAALLLTAAQLVELKPQRRLVTIGVGVGVGVRVMAAAPLGTGLSERSACV